jgi:hypothetical protein
MNNFYDINSFIEENNISRFSEIILLINSFSSYSVYNVSIFYVDNLDKYKINCSCGEKFNIGKRKKCKHINYVLQSLYRDIENAKNNIFRNVISKKNINKSFPSLNNMYELLENINNTIENEYICEISSMVNLSE